MEIFNSIVGSIASKVAEYTVDLAARQLGYLFKHKTKFLNLRSKVQDLKDAKEMVQQSVDAANRNGEEIFDHVQSWLAAVNEKISEEAETKLQKDEVKAMKRCFSNFCPDFKSRYLLSKKADKEADAIAQLLAKKDAFSTVCYLPVVEARDIIRPVKEYEAFGSRSGAFDEVMAALEDDTVSVVGVYGMGGVGKTTLVKEVAKKKLSFDEVVFVAVTQTPNTINIQNEIATQLGLKLDNDPSVDVRAARLRDRLKKAKKVLVILDDIWEKQEVDTLGIPSADQHKGCKILMTSRRLDVLKLMDSHPNISIETLKEDEAWNLFKKMAGPIVERSDLESTAVEVAKRCAGLPIAIATIAKALKSKEHLYEWSDILRQLSKPSERNFKGIPGEAYSAIELSYKFLEGEELGPIFLLCSIMSHNAAVEDLLRYAIGLGFIHDVSTMKESRNRVLTLINNLKASCLLLEGSQPNCFDMHDVVRDVAHSIASRDLHWLALFKEWPEEEKMKESQLISLQNAEVSELHHELECPNLNYFSIGLEGCSSLKISNNFFKGMQRLKVLEFSRTNFTALPSTIVYLKTLCTLRLVDCGLKDIIILGELGNLEILDLHGSSIVVLPKEMGQLTRLKLLDLSDCDDLEVILPNVLSKLSRLEELYLYGSFDRWEVEGTEKPRSNASLVELQHLSRLTTLEVHIPVAEAIPKDNLFLGKMERFKISIGGDTWDWYYDKGMETSRMLKLKINKSTHLIDEIYKMLSRKAESLYLDGLEDAGELLYDPNAESFGRLRFVKVENCSMLKNLFSFSIAKRLCQLEELEVSNCENITELIVEKEKISENDILGFNKLRILKLNNLNRFNGMWYSENTFQSSAWLFDKKVSCPALEELYLDSIGGIEKIWHIDDQLPLMPSCIHSLSSLEVKRCHKLKYVFTSSMVENFVQLKNLVVSECEEMEGVIEGSLEVEEGISSSIRVFPKLDYLDLYELPRLKRFCCGINSIEFPSLRHLTIYECPSLNTFTSDIGKTRTSFSSDQKICMTHYFFNERVILPVLQELEISYMNNLERLWPNQLAEHSFSKLTSIALDDCPKLVNVFPSSMLARLQRLDSLSIVFCKSLEEIVFGSQYQGGSSSALPSLSPQLVQSDAITFEFPNLTSLDLHYLPNLRSVHHKMLTISWPSLKEMRVRECNKVKTLFASQETRGNTDQHPLFWVNESTFSNLHQLTLGWNDGIKDIIWHLEGQQHQLLSRYFRNLKVVKLEQIVRVEWYPERLILWPCYLFHLLSLPNLQTLEISHSCFEEMIFPSEVGGEKKSAPPLLSQITELRLDTLPDLIHIWKEKEGFPNLRILHVENCSRLKFYLVPSSISFRNLVSLEVNACYGIIKLITHTTAKSLVQLKQMSILHCHELEEIIEGGDDDDEISFPQLNHLGLKDLPKLESFCSSLQILVPSSVSFRNLVTLEVWKCDVIIKIITHSRAKSLVQLKEMSIRRCEKIEEIIEGGDDDEISFPQLNRLELEDLPKLESFCSSENYNIGFPSLEILLLHKCPKMKMFSKVDSNTPMLQKVRLDVLGYQSRWEGTLNSTIQQLFREKHAMGEECEDSKEDESKPSTSNTQNLIQEV